MKSLEKLSQLADKFTFKLSLAQETDSTEIGTSNYVFFGTMDKVNSFKAIIKDPLSKILMKAAEQADAASLRVDLSVKVGPDPLSGKIFFSVAAEPEVMRGPVLSILLSSYAKVMGKTLEARLKELKDAKKFPANQDHDDSIFNASAG